MDCNDSETANFVLEKHRRLAVSFVNSGASRRIRTLSLLIRSQMLYPVKLWMQRFVILYHFMQIASKNNIFISFSVSLHNKFHYSVRDIRICNCCHQGQIVRPHE